MKRLLWLALFLPTCLTAQQAGSGSLPLATYIMPIHPPVEYAIWYHETERCAGRPGNFHDVHWYVVPQAWGTDTAHLTYGEWRIDKWGHHTITVNANDMRDSVLVMHESLHDILWTSGWRPTDTTRDARHPIPPFNTCAPKSYHGRSP